MEKNVLIGENEKEENRKIQETLKEIMHNNMVLKIKTLIKSIEEKDKNADAKLIIGNTCGAAKTTVSKWQEENGRNPELWTLLPLTNMLGCSIDELLRGFELTDKDISELEALGVSEESALKTVEYYSKEKIEERASQTIIDKMGIASSKEKISSLQNLPKNKYLFGPEDIISEVKYSELLNYTIDEPIIDNSLHIFIDTLRRDIMSYLGKQYGKFDYEERLKKYKEEITIDKNRLDTETIYQNIKSTLNVEEVTKMEDKIKKEFEQFLHKAVVELLFPRDNKDK